jgi:hypothetical protein
VDRYGGVHSLLIYISSTLGCPTCHQANPAGKYLLSKISKSGEGQYFVYSVGRTRAVDIEYRLNIIQ